jgi:hypothetical protein
VRRKETEGVKTQDIGDSLFDGKRSGKYEKRNDRSEPRWSQLAQTEVTNGVSTALKQLSVCYRSHWQQMKLRCDGRKSPPCGTSWRCAHLPPRAIRPIMSRLRPSCRSN